ncbi:PAC2 family protein [Pseudokineococcus sp. 1T1Z-3]|uniref:PAC2 family protein n=1 Tax=Pseudokineococcus sp. 1T1Z-3 TaxID=3132745 RepID=UPI0030A0AB0A
MSEQAGRPGPGAPELRDPVVLAAFEGWNDAAEAASGALDHLARVWGETTFAELDPEDYHDFQVNRPVTGFDEDGRRRTTWPTTRLAWARPPGADRDVVLVHGIEPSMRWRSYTAELLAHADAVGARTLVTLGALLADVPHTRPIPVTSTGTPADGGPTLDHLALEPSRYEGPTGIVGVVADAAAGHGLTSVSLWAAVPHYVGQSPSPKAVLALLGRVEEVVGSPVPMEDLAEEAEAWERGVDELAGEDEEIGEYVQQLEQAKDTAELPEASGEAIAREFERYLRRRGDEGPRRGPAPSA